MSVKRGRGAKMLKGPQNEHQRQKGLLDSVDSPNLSAIEKISFLEGLQLNDGNPLHSTAVEEDLNMSEQGQENKGSTGENDHRQLSKTAAQQRVAPVKRKEMDREEEEEEKKKKRKGIRGEVKARPKKKRQTKSQAPQRKRGETGVEREKSEPCTMVQEVQQSNPTSSNQIRHSARKKSARTNSEQMSAARLVKNQPKKQTGSRKSSEPQSQEESDTSANQQGSDDILLSNEEVTDEDTSWNPSPHKVKMSGLGRSDKSASRKSSSGSLSAEGKQVVSDEQTKRRRKGQQGTELEVVLDAFLDFCGQYRESVESKAIKQSIDCFSSNVKEQLQEKISSFKELRFLKRENNKVRSLISAKTQRLLDAKYELMRAERQAWLLQKERDKLELRLSDLRRSQAFLRDIRELNSQYLDYRRKHPKERETYGASSLPALLLEAKHVHSAELQLRGINDRLEKRLNETRK